LHSGEIRAESPGKGQGATFTLEIPLCIAADKDREFP
jgi:signal transduction histidine kinase